MTSLLRPPAARVDRAEPPEVAAAPRAGWVPSALVLAGPALLAVALSAYGIASRSLGFDEAASVTIASQHGHALWAAIAHDGGNMSGYYLLLHLLIGAFGDGLTVIRLPSLVAAAATAALVAAIGLRLYGRRVGAAAGILCAVSLPLVYWAQYARGYAPMVAFVCGAFLAFTSLMAPEARGRRAWVGLVACLALGMYSSFVAALVVPAMLLAVAVVRPRLLARFVAAMAAVALCAAPLAALAVHRGSSQLFWVPRPNFMFETQALQTVTSAGMQPSFHRTPPTTGLMLATIALLLAISGLLVWGAIRSAARARWAGVTLVSWLFVPVLLAWAASFVIQPLFVPRNLLVSVPAVALVLAVGICDRRVPRALGILALVVIVGLRGEQVVAAYGVSPEPWRQSVAYVMARARPGDCIAFYPADARMAFRYYLTPSTAARAPRSILPAVSWSATRPFVEEYLTMTPSQIATATRGCRRLWLVGSHEGQTTPSQSRQNLERFERLRQALERVYGKAPIKQYGYAAAIHIQLLPGPPG